jgi:hypothetical protein
MSTMTTRGASPVAGDTGSGKGSVLWSWPAAMEAAERQILLGVDRGGILIAERELRYQLARKDKHPLAQADKLLDVLAEFEARGLIEAELCFGLTSQGRARLAELVDDGGRAER